MHYALYIPWLQLFHRHTMHYVLYIRWLQLFHHNTMHYVLYISWLQHFHCNTMHSTINALWIIRSLSQPFLGAIIMHQTSDDTKLFIQCILYQLNSSLTPGNPSWVISDSIGEENVIFSGDRGEKVPWNRHRWKVHGLEISWFHYYQDKASWHSPPPSPPTSLPPPWCSGQRYIFVRLTKCRTLRLVTFLQGSTMHCVFLIPFTLLFYVPFSTKPFFYRTQHQCTASTLSTKQYYLLKYSQLCHYGEITLNCFKMLRLSYFSHWSLVWSTNTNTKQNEQNKSAE